MLVEILEPVATRTGTLQPGRLVEMSEGAIRRLDGKVRVVPTAEPIDSNLERLSAEFGDDPEWLKWKVHPLAVNHWAANMDIAEIRRKGSLPHGYVHEVECQSCGPVLLASGMPERVPACVWCMNRAAGLPIPRLEHHEERKL